MFKQTQHDGEHDTGWGSQQSKPSACLSVLTPHFPETGSLSETGFCSTFSLLPHKDHPLLSPSPLPPPLPPPGTREVFSTCHGGSQWTAPQTLTDSFASLRHLTETTADSQSQRPLETQRQRESDTREAKRKSSVDYLWYNSDFQPSIQAGFFS